MLQHQPKLMEFRIKKLQNPFNVMNISDSNRCVIIILCSNDVVLCSGSLHPHNLELPLSFAKIREFPRMKVKLISHNSIDTFLLNKNQSVYTFSSYRSLMKIDGIENVKYLVINESMYFIIKSSNDNKLFLELYDSSKFAFNVQNPTRQFDLTWQKVEGSAELTRENEKYFVKIIQLNSKNMSLMNALLVEDSKRSDQILLLSIDEKLYWINYTKDELDYTIETILVMRSKIVAMELMQNLFLVLEHSVLSLYFTTTEPRILSLKEIYLGEILSFEFVHEKCCFVYSNGFKIFILYFLIPGHENSHYEKVEIELSGIVAMTYVMELNLILGISENNLFYQIPLKNKKIPSTLSREEFIEIEPQHVNEIKNINRILDIKRRGFLELEKMYEEEQKQLVLIKSWNNLEEQNIMCKRIYNSDDQTVHFEVDLKNCNIEAFENFKICLSCESEENTNVISTQSKISDNIIKLVLSKKNLTLNISSVSLHRVIDLHKNPRILKYFLQFEETSSDRSSEIQQSQTRHSNTLIQRIENITSKQETKF